MTDDIKGMKSLGYGVYMGSIKVKLDAILGLPISTVDFEENQRVTILFLPDSSKNTGDKKLENYCDINIITIKKIKEKLFYITEYEVI